MARMGKHILKVNTASAIRGDQWVVESPAAQGAKEASIGPRSYTNIFGELVERGDARQVPEIHPLFVSQQNDRNPYLYYLIDKLSEGFATSFDEWQNSTRIRGQVIVFCPWPAQGYIIEQTAGLLYEESPPSPQSYPSQSQHDLLIRNRMIDLSIPDDSGPLPAEQAITMGIAGSVVSQLRNQLSSITTTITEAAESLGPLLDVAVATQFGPAGTIALQAIRSSTSESGGGLS